MEDLETIQRCRDRDKAAFEALYQAYALKALRTAFLMTHQSNMAEDAVQETFVQVWTSIDKLRDVHAFRAWFFRILINRVKYLGKRDKGNHTLPLETAVDHRDDHTPRPEDQAERDEELRRVQTAIARLPEPQRVPVILRYFSELSEEEIAATLGIPAGTVKSRLHTARARLQEQLSDHHASFSLTGLKANPENRK